MILTMLRLSADMREIALGRLLAGDSVTVVANALNVHKSTISRLKSLFETTGTTKDRQRTGQLSVISDRQKRAIVRTYRRNPFTSASHTARDTVGRHRHPVSKQTVGRILRAENLKCR